MIVGFNDKFGQFGVETAVAFQRMATHFGNGPVARLEIMAQATHRTAGDRVF